jgi:hypothetical protein
MLYFGPEIVAPVASVLAGVAGMLMLFWQRVRAFGQRCVDGVRSLFRRGDRRPVGRDGARTRRRAGTPDAPDAPVARRGTRARG